MPTLFFIFILAYKNAIFMPQNNPSQNSIPCTFFNDAQQKPWFRVESQLTNFNGIKGCLTACLQAIEVQAKTGSPALNDKWYALQETLKDAERITKQIEIFWQEEEKSPNTSPDGGGSGEDYFPPTED